MLYIDQPNQVGFSYDEPTNGTAVYDDQRIYPGEFPEGAPEGNYTHRLGTFPSQKPSHTTNSTAQAAHALWHFAQTWFTEFPHYKPVDDRISLWAESYGGHYGPGFARFFQEQNEKIEDGTIEDGNAHYLHLDTLGIVNGFMDSVIQSEYYIDFPYNNVSWSYIPDPRDRRLSSTRKTLTQPRHMTYKSLTNLSTTSSRETGPPPAAAKTSSQPARTASPPSTSTPSTAATSSPPTCATSLPSATTPCPRCTPP
jgi:carboxypeptidase C (cathepsin A)